MLRQNNPPTHLHVWFNLQAVSGSIFLVGEQLSCADVQLMECTLMLEEKFPGILAQFPNIKVQFTQMFLRNYQYACPFITAQLPVNCKYIAWEYIVSPHYGFNKVISWHNLLYIDSHISFQSFQGRMSEKPAIKRFLQPGSKRKQQPDDAYIKTVMEVFNLKAPIIR